MVLKAMRCRSWTTGSSPKGVAQLSSEQSELSIPKGRSATGAAGICILGGVDRRASLVILIECWCCAQCLQY